MSKKLNCASVKGKRAKVEMIEKVGNIALLPERCVTDQGGRQRGEIKNGQFDLLAQCLRGFDVSDNTAFRVAHTTLPLSGAIAKGMSE
jgi:hypothetical protein